MNIDTSSIDTLVDIDILMTDMRSAIFDNLFSILFACMRNGRGLSWIRM